MKLLLVKIFGFPAILIHGDTLVLDRWVWLKKRLLQADLAQQLIDVGCIGNTDFNLLPMCRLWDRSF